MRNLLQLGNLSTQLHCPNKLLSSLNAGSQMNGISEEELGHRLYTLFQISNNLPYYVHTSISCQSDLEQSCPFWNLGVTCGPYRLEIELFKLRCAVKSKITTINYQKYVIKMI